MRWIELILQRWNGFIRSIAIPTLIKINWNMRLEKDQNYNEEAGVELTFCETKISNNPHLDTFDESSTKQKNYSFTYYTG